MAKLSFKPVCHSWVALHPKPKGVVQFVGGAFFGTFAPMLFYRHLLQYLYDQAYSVIILPFNFSFNHYKESFFLLREQYALIPELVTMAVAQGDNPEVYLKADNYIWLGHSIGCKYVALLESAGKLPQDKVALTAFVRKVLTPTDRYSDKMVQQVVDQLQALREELMLSAEASRKLVENCMVGTKKVLEANSSVPKLIYNDLYIKNQLSVLLAPVASDTSSAVPSKALANWIDNRGWGVQPTSTVTKNLIKESGLFNLLVLTQFKADKIALQTIEWFFDVLNKPNQSDRKYLGGGHLRPLGFNIADLVINPWFDLPLITSQTARNQALETPLEQAIQTIKRVQASS